MVSILETMKTFSAEDGLTEEALVMKLRTCHYHHLFLHTSLRQNVSGMGFINKIDYDPCIVGNTPFLFRTNPCK